MHQTFPLSDNKNIRIYYLLTICTSAAFIMSNWIFFWERFMTYGQLGIVDGLAFAFGLIMEIPTGGFADMLGKKKTLIISMICASFGVLALSFSSSVYTIFGFFLFWQLGMAFYSGAAEALAYDTLVSIKQEQHFDKVIATKSMMSIIMGIVSILIGSWMYTLHFRLPHVAWGVAYVFGLIATLYLTEPPDSVGSGTFSWHRYFRQLADGTRHLFQPSLKHLLPLVFLVSGVSVLYHVSFIQPAMAVSFGFDQAIFGVILAVLGITAAIITRLIPRIRTRVSNVEGLVILAMMLGLGFFGAFFPLGYYGIVVLLMIGIAERLTSPWVSIVVNEHLSSQYRATALSVVALVAHIPYAVIAIAAGKLIEDGHLSEFSLAVAVVIFTLTGATLLTYRFARLRAKTHPEIS